MGFAGSLRRLVRKSKKTATGAVDIAEASKSIVGEAKRLNLNELSDLFSTKYMKVVDNKALVGAIDIADFVHFSRLGDYSNSFYVAFKDTDVLASSNVQKAIKKVLSEAATELPDLPIKKYDEAIIRSKVGFNLDKKALNTVDDIDKFVKNDAKLQQSVDKLVQQSKRTGFLKFFGYSVAISAAGLTALVVYQKCVEEAAKSTGCFMYTQSGTNVVKCKVSQFSCKNATTGNICTSKSLPDEIANSKACSEDANKNLNCIETLCDAARYADLQDNQVLRCESKSASDVLVDAINQAGSGIGSVVGSVGKNLLIWGLVAIVVIIIFTFLFKFFTN